MLEKYEEIFDVSLPGYTGKQGSIECAVSNQIDRLFVNGSFSVPSFNDDEKLDFKPPVIVSSTNLSQNNIVLAVWNLDSKDGYYRVVIDIEMKDSGSCGEGEIANTFVICKKAPRKEEKNVTITF